jgi:hypothetical protein
MPHFTSIASKVPQTALGWTNETTVPVAQNNCLKLFNGPIDGAEPVAGPSILPKVCVEVRRACEP